MIESFKLPTITPETLTGSIVSFNDEYGGLPLKSCTSLISGYQEGSGVPSPSNVRPLHAFSGASLGKCDNNTASLWNIDNSFNGDVEFNQLILTENKDYTNDYTDTRENLFFQIVSITSPAQSYIYRTVTSVGKLNLMFKPSTVTQGLRIKHNGVSRDLLIYNSTTETLSANHVYLVDVVFDGINPTVVGGIDSKNLQLFDLTQMFGSTIADYIYNLETQTAGAGVAFFKALYPNDYYPYNAGTKQLVGDTLATFTFGQSIYQGSIDWKRGVVVGTHKVITYDGSSDEIWHRYTLGSARDFAMYNDNFLGSNVDTIPNSNYLMGLSHFETWGNYDKWASISVVDKLITGIMSITDVEVWKTYLSNNPLTVGYELATPIEIPLGGIQLLTQEGQNNIYADCGDTTLEWLKVN